MEFSVNELLCVCADLGRLTLTLRQVSHWSLDVSLSLKSNSIGKDEFMKGISRTLKALTKPATVWLVGFFVPVGLWGQVFNPDQIAILRWYSANLTTAFSVGTGPLGVAFDGLNIWVVNNLDNTVTKLRAATADVQGTFSVGSGPYAVAFDGGNIWTATA